MGCFRCDKWSKTDTAGTLHPKKLVQKRKCRLISGFSPVAIRSADIEVTEEYCGGMWIPEKLYRGDDAATYAIKDANILKYIAKKQKQLDKAQAKLVKAQAAQLNADIATTSSGRKRDSRAGRCSMSPDAQRPEPALLQLQPDPTLVH